MTTDEMQMAKVAPEPPITEDFEETSEQQPQQSSKWNYLNYPKGVYFICGTEFCERFAYYGLRAVLVLYLLIVHQLPESTCKLIYHSFIVVCYVAPIFCSMLADGCLGRYKVILLGCIGYTVGNLLLTLGSVAQLNGSEWGVLDFVGLGIIALATGCIKPCVPTFAANQFPSEMRRQREQFFSVFYMVITCGSLLATLIIPVLRQQKCLGSAYCFPLAFGIPILLMLGAILVLVAGVKYYKVLPRSDVMLVKVFSCIWHAIKGRIVRKEPGKIHWLYYASDVCEETLIRDVIIVLRLVVLFVPLIFFWALFEQMGSTWILQGNEMNGHMGKVTLFPDQMAILNPLLILVFIPIFESFVYPTLRKYKILKTPLQKMGCGGVLAAFAFMAVGFVQIAIDNNSVVLPSPSHSRFFFINLADQPIKIKSMEKNFTLAIHTQSIEDFSSTFEAFSMGQQIPFKPMEFNEKKAYLIAFFAATKPSGGLKNSLSYRIQKFDLSRCPGGNSTVFVLADPVIQAGDTVLSISEGSGDFSLNTQNQSKLAIHPALFGNGSDFEVRLIFHGGDTIMLQTVELGMGGVYGLALGNILREPSNYQIVELVPPYSVSILYQIFGFIIMTVAHIMFFISGLEFSYSQAPVGMKSVVQALYYMTVGIGNIFDMIIFGADLLQYRSTEFFVFAALMFAAVGVFVPLAIRYEYVDKYDFYEDVDDPNAYYRSEFEGDKDQLVRSRTNSTAYGTQ